MVSSLTVIAVAEGVIQRFTYLVFRYAESVSAEGEDSATTISTELDTPYIKSVNTDPNSGERFFM